MTDTLRTKLIKLAHAKPELRPHLLPILKIAEGDKVKVLNEDGKEVWVNRETLNDPKEKGKYKPVKEEAKAKGPSEEEKAEGWGGDYGSKADAEKTRSSLTDKALKLDEELFRQGLPTDLGEASEFSLHSGQRSLEKAIEAHSAVLDHVSNYPDKAFHKVKDAVQPHSKKSEKYQKQLDKVNAEIKKREKARGL